MNSNFIKFKRRALGIRIAKSVLAGAAGGLVFGGLFLMLSRLAVISPEPIISLPIGVGALVVAGLLCYLLLRTSDMALAKRLDKDYALNERVQTMIERSGDNDEMLRMQREDTEAVLSKIDVQSFKARRLWIYITALVLGVCILVAAFIVPDKRGAPPVEDPPFRLSDMQRAGLNELIAYVEKSSMEEEYRVAIAEELRTLLSDLEIADKMSKMRTELAESMAYILDITYNSSSSTEILNALWDSGDVYLKHLAKTLDTSSWNTPDWGDYAEKLTDYIAVILGDDKEPAEGAPPPTEETKKTDLAYILESSGRKIPLALDASGISEIDALYAVLKRLASADEPGLKGYSVLATTILALPYEEATEAVRGTVDGFAESIYEAISQNRINAFVGEYTMTRLSTLFLVPLPEFERPDFVKNNESIDGSSGGGSKEDDNQDGPTDGGFGEGATFGSDDLVLNPLTGKLVTYGELIHQYNALMAEKLENGSYSDKQKEMIKKYFDLLYSGIKKEEGN